MPKKKALILIAIIILLIIAVPLLAVLQDRSVSADVDSETQNITVWQIDGFEGGQGSRSKYLQTAGEKCFKKEKIYVSVASITADSARTNLKMGKIPDIISYSAGFYGIEKYINGKDFLYKTWCRGGYCFLSLEENSGFSDINSGNTLINRGKDNLSGVAATLSGVGSSESDEPTNAYLKLLNGKYKYLFGTQRDIYRLKTRNVAFSVKPVTAFNDLYQNVSILTQNSEKYKICLRFTTYLIKNNRVSGLGLISGNNETDVDELREIANAEYEYTLRGPCGKDYIDELKNSGKSGDINKIKNLLK